VAQDVVPEFKPLYCLTKQIKALSLCSGGNLLQSEMLIILFGDVNWVRKTLSKEGLSLDLGRGGYLLAQGYSPNRLSIEREGRCALN
jgi:hypothetical protein